ncbi:hypothetical protein ACROYT_G001773 [Oculina patagonica]
MREAHISKKYEVQEHDDSGIFQTKYTVVSANDTHAHLHRTWTNFDYHQFADGTPAKGEHKVQSQHSVHVHVKNGKVDKVHRKTSAFLRPANGHPRAENFKDFAKQDIEMSASGYSKLMLRSCSDPEHQRSKRSTTEKEHLKTMKFLTRDSLLFGDTDKIKWSEVGGEKKKARPLHEVLRCFVDKSIQEREIGYCTNELHHMVRNNNSVFRAVKKLVQNRNHQNLTSWGVCAAALAAHAGYEAQNVLAHAVRRDNPRPLTSEEYETLLISIFYLPDGPLHSSLFNALFELMFRDEKGEDVTTTAMLVLAGLTERAKRAGYNDTLSDSVAEMIHHRYRNRSSLYHPDSEEYESHLRDHVWAFGNLGHHSGLPVILEHIDHDNSDIRSAVISAMRKLSPKQTDQHLMRALYRDEHSEVKAAVVNVFIDRHQNLTESVVQGLEHALEYADKDETLDSSIQEFLENHGDHSSAVNLRKKRSMIHRRKRALIPQLRPREYVIGQSKRWDMAVGGEWLGAETAIQFMNRLQLRVGIFGGKFEVNLDNFAIIRAHILKVPFEIAKGKAAFKASASFKNDFPKDLIHIIADAGDELLRNFDSITSVITKEIEKFRTKLAGYVPLNIDKFTDFVNNINEFLQDLTLPLKAIKGTGKIISFSKDMGDHVKRWKILKDRIVNIQLNLARLTGFETLFKNFLGTLDRILGIIDGVSKYLPNNMPAGFNIKSLLQILRKVPVSQQTNKTKEYFETLGTSVPDGFRRQFPFKFSIHMSLSLDEFQKVVLRLQRFSSSLLDIFFLLDSLEGTEFPKLRLPSLKIHSPTFQGSGFNFGLRFDWKATLKYDLKLKSLDFQEFIDLFEDMGNFFGLFTGHNFDLEEFFREILPGGKFGLQRHFPRLFNQVNHESHGNSSDSSGLLQAFLSAMVNVLDFHVSNVSAISHMTDFFQELGPEVTQFAKRYVQKTCRIHETALNYSHEFEDFTANIEKDGIFLLWSIQNTTQKVLLEFLNFTIILDTLTDEIERNFTASTKDFISDTLQGLTGNLRDIQTLASGVVDLLNGTSSKLSGACTKAAAFSAGVIDEVQNEARLALNELSSVIGPVATSIKTAGTNLKSAVTKVEIWYEENLAARVGKISHVSQIVTDFLSVLNTKKGFLNTVRDIAFRLNVILKHLRNLPAYANKVRKTVDEVIHFANTADNYQDEIEKLDIREHFGIDFDQRLLSICDKFNATSAEMINKVWSIDVVKEVNNYFREEVNMFVDTTIPKFKNIKDSVHTIKGALREVSSMVSEVMVVLQDLQPFTRLFSPILENAKKLPDCREMKQIFYDSTDPCVRKALSVGAFGINQYKDLKNEIEVLNSLVPKMWKNFRLQKCVRGGMCISKAFIEQGKVIKDKVSIVKDKLVKSSEYADVLKDCEKGVNNMTEVVDVLKELTEQVQNISYKREIQRVKTILQKITGRTPDQENIWKGSGIRKRSIEYSKYRLERTADYLQKAQEVENQIQNFQENTFQALRGIYEDHVLKHINGLESTLSKLKMSYQLWQKMKDVNIFLTALDTSTTSALGFADKFQGVLDLFSDPTLNLLAGTKELSVVLKPHLDKYASEMIIAVGKVNGLLNDVADFLNQIQTRQRGLDPRAYKPWQDIPYCSEEVCLRSIRRSSPLYLSTIFTWKFPHLDDLSSMQKSGRWLTPGLFDDYKVEGVAQLSGNEIILGMHGVASNEDKASLLVVTNFDRGVKKIVQLSKSGTPLSVKIGGITVAKEYIWISDGYKNEILSVRVSHITSTFSSPKPSQVVISKTVSVEGTAGSVSYDEQSNILWVTDGNKGKAHGYKLLSNGDLSAAGIAPDRVIHIGKNAQGMTIVRQFGKEYACISRCALIAGFQCKLEFHHLNGDDKTGENTLARVVRTPSGLESVTRVDNEVIAVGFSSGTFAEKDNVELVGGDFEDRYFKLRLPILDTTFGINENCFYFRLMSNYIIRPRRVFPIGDMICGTKRKRSISQELLETDVYHEKLEDIHKNSKRVRRSVTDQGSCISFFEGSLFHRSQTFFEYSTVIPVLGIPVRLFAGAGGHFSVGYHGQFCLKTKAFRLGVIPGAWISVYAGASVPLLIIEVGVTIEARLLETYLVPELLINIDRWPLKACIQLKIRMTPLSIRVYLWFKVITIKIKVWFIGISIKISYSNEKIIWEWWWREKAIERNLFTTCKADKDRTPPEVGKCTAQQVADTKYFVQWNGFKEDKRIMAYQVRIGSIKGSGDDYSSWVGTSQSQVVKGLPIMHGRNVFVSVLATNDGGMDSPLAYCPLFQARRNGPRIRYVYDGVVKEKDADYQSDTFSLGMNFAFKSDFNEIVNLKWGVSSNSICTFDESEANVVPLASLGDSYSIQVSGLDLEHGKTYFTRLYAMDKFGLKAVMCSDGILIDTTQPIPTHFQDGAGEDDANFLPSLRRVRGKFDPFIDPESPIIKYEWKIVQNISGEDVTAFVSIPLTQQTPLMDGLSLEAGSPYRLVLRGTNAAGHQAVIETNGFIPDSTPPVCKGQVIDVTNETDTSDVDFVRELNSIQAKWKCFDRESGIRLQLLSVGTYPGGDDIRAFEELSLLSHSTAEGSMSYVQFPNITIFAKVRYHITIKIINGAGLKKTIFSDGILIDMTPPTVAPQYIKDGVGRKDKNFTSERFTFSAHWKQAFADAESGLAEYRVGLGTKPGLADIKAFSSVGSETNVTITGILLQSGQRYFATVVGCNRVGMCVTASSNGAIVDFVPPHAGKVVTGLKGPPVFYQWMTKSVWARWNWCLVDEKRVSLILNNSQCSNDSFYDVHSGIDMFGISVVSQSTDQLLAPFKLAGRQRYTGRNINLPDGVYSVAIEASDKAGIAARGLSNTFIVDSSPPLIILVQHGHFGETLASINTSVVTFQSYFVVEDDLSQVKAYKVGVGSYSGADDIVKFQFFSLPLPTSSLRANWTSHKPTFVTNNRRYFITLLAINSAGLFTIKSSAPLLSDFEAPQNGVVLDGWGLQDAVYQSLTSLYRAHWYGFTDFTGIEKVYLGLSSKSNSMVCDVKKEEIVSNNNNFHVLSGLALISGQKYYACLKLVDRAGNSKLFQSNGVVIDTSPPRPGYVIDGRPGEEIDIQMDRSVLRASWGNFTERETKLVSYHLAFGSFPGGQDVQELTDVGMTNMAASSRLKVSELTTGQRYYASVIAYNALGMPSSMVASDGVLVDFTPPIFSQPVRDGDDLSKDLRYVLERSLKASWKCEDHESGLATIEIAFGLQPGEADTMNFTSLPVSQTTFVTHLNLQTGYRYFASVRCTNKVGQTTISLSAGIVYDNTPPSPVYVRDGDYQDIKKTLSITFKFVDAESGIEAYKVQVWGGGSYKRSVEIYGSFSFDGNFTRATLALSKELDSGKTYYVNVTAVNGVGLEATKQSDGFVVDTTPPICSKVWDGKDNYQDDTEYAPSSNRFVISWVCYDTESPIVRYRFSVKEVETNKYTIPFYTSKTRVNSSGSAIITGGGRTTTKFEEGHSYASGIEIVNAVGLTTVSWTNGVIIDSTPPVVSNLRLVFNPQGDSLIAEWLVSDKESGLKSVSWGLGTTPEANDIKSFAEVSPSITNISISSVSFQQGRSCFLNILAVNNGGLLSKSSSSAIIIDRSAPNPGIVAAHHAFPRNYDESKNKVPNSSFAVSWTGFTDSESGIKKTSWAVGTDCQTLKQGGGDLYTEIIADNSVGGVIIGNQTLVENKTYCVCIRVANGAGLHRTDCSPGMLVILGKLSAGVVSDGPVTSANDIDFQLDDRAIWAHWSGFKDPVFGISSYDWCIGDKPPNPFGSESCAWPFMEVHHLKTKASRFHNLTLTHGKKYYVSVKAENTRGDTVVSSSDGVVIDRTPPIAKSIQISPSSGKDTLFLTSPSAPVVTWSIDDPESGISHFFVSVGSIPFQSDLIATQRVDSLSRSLDLDQVNFTLYQGSMFYVTVTGVNMLGLETVITSQQVVVDWTSPGSGEIVDGNNTNQMTEVFIHTDYQRDNGMWFAHWSGIHDSESDVVEYHWCIGTAPGTCGVKSMTSAGPNTTVHHSFAPSEGLQYFFTVEATNGAGLKEEVYSEGFTVDTSPPVIEGVHHGVEGKDDDILQLMTQNSGVWLAFYWNKPYDTESGISSVEWCAGTNNNSCNIVSLTSANPEDTSVQHYMSQSLAPGTVVVVMLVVTNGAGMTSTVATPSLLIDTTPPSAGNVTVGTTAVTTYVKKGNSITATWSGFSDGESHLNHFEWAICQAITKDKCISPYKNIGVGTTTEIDVVGIDSGVSYVVVVRAFNKVGLFSEASSNQFILDGAKPSAGTVYDGLERKKDLEFQSSTTQISANWSPFVNVNGEIADYEMCVGTEPETCDVSGFISLGIKLTGTITALSLNHNGRYFVTVRGTSESGYSTTATSNGVRVDSTPALGGKVRDGQTLIDIDYQAADTYIYANWDEFQDDESDITGYTWCAGTEKGICDIISENDVGDRTSASQQIMPPLPGGISIFVTVSTFNNAGVATTVSSDGFKVDDTAPILSKVLDLKLSQGDDDVDFFTSKDSVCVGWNVADYESGVLKSKVSVCSALNTNDCLLYDLDVGNQTFACLADLEFKEGVKYMTKIRAENYVGLSTELYSDGFLVDSTPPFMGEIIFSESLEPSLEETTEQFSHSIIAVQWNGLWDKESGVRISYVCVGTNPGECNRKNFTGVIESTSYTFQDLPLVQGEKYFVSVKAENGAGLTSDVKTSDGIVIDKTGPINGGAILDGSKNGEDIDIQHSRTLVAAHWNAFEDLESDVIKVNWCAGLSPGTCDLVKETQLDQDNTFVFMVLTKPIVNGQRYYVTVKATNGAGVTTSVTSDGVLVDDSPPISGTVIDGSVLDVDYVNSEDDVSARWSDFVDEESGIESYEVALCTVWNISLCPQPFTAVGNTTNITIAGLDLESGVQYKFIVRAINGAGVKVEAFSTGFTVDFTPPIEGNVWVGAGNMHVMYQSDSTKVVVSWTPFTDVESGILNYEVCLSSHLQNCTVTAFIDVGLNTSYTIDDLHLTHGKTYYTIVRGTNGIGVSSETNSNGFLIDLTLPTLQSEGPFWSSKAPFGSNQTFSKDNQRSSPIKFRCSEEHLTCSWEEFEDQESGMVKYEWCVGTAKALCDVVSMRSVGMKTRGAAIVNRLPSGTKLFSTVYAVNGARLRRRITSDPCAVITVAPKLAEVIDISSFNTSNFTDIDWKATMQNLSLQWNIIGSYLDEISQLRVQVAVTKLSSNLSVPRLIQEMSWNGEPLKQPFMDVLSWQRNVTIRSVTFDPWERYRGIVRVWNKEGIFTEASSDGLKMEPSPPPTRALAIRDKAAENEHKRWWPNLRIPPLNQSALDTDFTYISSPAKVELTVSSDPSNETFNKTDFILDYKMFSPTAEFKIVVKRITSGKNDTNITSYSKTMKVIPGFAESEGPCCAKRSVDAPTALSDTHFKPTSPTEDFGVSLAVLLNDVVAIGCKGKVVLQSLKNQTASDSITLDDLSNPNARVRIASYHNRTSFLLNGKVHLYESSPGDSGGTVLHKTIAIGKCKNVSMSHCSQSETWAENLGQAFALNEHVLAVSGTNPTTSNSVVAVFRQNAGNWTFFQAIGEDVKDANFGHSISLNNRIMAIAAGEGKNCCIYIYSIPTMAHLATICIAESASLVAPLSMYLTETDALVVLSKTSRLLKVFQFNITSNSYQEVCEYRAGRIVDELSGNFDVNTREEGFIVALGIEANNGAEGVQLLGFQGIYSNNLHERKETSECVNLGSVLARKSGLRVDGSGTRTSVSFRDNTILFGIPGVLTWPNNDQWLSTGRVFMATYCPLNHFRTRASGLQSLRPTSCVPCKQGRKSFGGFVEACSVCTGRICSSPQINDSSSFTLGICDDTSCLSTSHLSNTTNGVKVLLANGSLFISGSEHVYTVELLETTRAGLSTSSFSESFAIDSTAPVPGVVYDGLGSDQNMNCSENSTFGENSQCSTRNLQDTDVNFTNNTREIHARWINFLDNESDIVEYFWCVGWQPKTDDIRVCKSTGIRQNGSHYGLSLKHGDAYYVTVIACNGARMCSAAHSDGVTIDTTPPIMKYVRDGVMGADMDYQVFLDIIFAYFSASDPDSGVTSYEVAWGTEPGLVDITDFEEVINITVWRAKLKDGALEVGKKYYATVRATNGAGLLSDWLSSNGIVVGKSEYVFDNSTEASFFFDTVNVYDNGTRKDGGVGQTYGTLTVPEGAVEEEVKLRCYSLDEKILNENKSEEGPVSDPSKTKPKHFMLGNYSFQIKALDPKNNTVQEGFQFAKPIKLSMFYDVNNLVKANKEHVNNEVTEEDIDPVLYLWDPKNETWFDAALTCPEPWSHVNHSMKLLEVNVCHLTQFAFFFSFSAQNGLILFDKNHSIYDSNGDIQVSRVETVTKVEIPVRRSKGSQGDITVEWSLYGNDSSDSLDLIQPTSGKVFMTDGQWNESFILIVDNEVDVPESVIWIQLENPTGGALLASRDKTTAKILIASNSRAQHRKQISKWIFTAVGSGVACVIVLLVVSCGIYRCRKKRERTSAQARRLETEMPNLKNAAGAEDDDRVQSTGCPHSRDNSDNEMETSFSTFKPEPGMAAANPLYDSTYSLTSLPGCSGAKGISNPLYESSFSVKEELGKVNYGAKGDEDDEDLEVGGL